MTINKIISHYYDHFYSFRKNLTKLDFIRLALIYASMVIGTTAVFYFINLHYDSANSYPNLHMFMQSVVLILIFSTIFTKTIRTKNKNILNKIEQQFNLDGKSLQKIKANYIKTCLLNNDKSQASDILNKLNQHIDTKIEYQLSASSNLLMQSVFFISRPLFRKWLTGFTIATALLALKSYIYPDYDLIMIFELAEKDLWLYLFSAGLTLIVVSSLVENFLNFLAALRSPDIIPDKRKANILIKDIQSVL